MNASAYGVDVENLVRRHARVRAGGDVSHRIAAGLARRQTRLGETPHRRLHVVELHEVELEILPSRDVAEAARVLLGDLRERAELIGGQQPLRDLDAQHRRVRVLTLTVGAAHQPELAPGFWRHVAALVLFEHVHEFVDIGFTREREPCASECVWIVLSRH